MATIVTKAVFEPPAPELIYLRVETELDSGGVNVQLVRPDGKRMTLLAIRPGAEINLLRVSSELAHEFGISRGPGGYPAFGYGERR